MEGQDEHAQPRDAAEMPAADIYGEDGVILPSFLSHIGAAIADRDTLVLKKDVGGLHESELGDLLEALDAGAAPRAGCACSATTSTFAR